MSDLTTVKGIDLVQFLNERGYRWVHKSPKNTTYLSPFRTESNASFMVNNYHNTWVDRGDSDPKSNHGDIISLVMRIDNVSFTEALEVLGHTKIVPTRHQEPLEKKKEIELVSVSELTDPTLLSYITIKRGINVDLAKRYCKQVEYSFPNGKYPDKTYISVGFENSLGGFELRNEVVKLSTDPKCFSVFKGEESECNIFEGFVNFLSYLTYFGIDSPRHTTYVLNGTGMINVLLPFLKEKKVNLYVDNDRGGNLVLSAISVAGIEYEDKRVFYEYYNDTNDFLLSKK
jgi:hypothetical protein